mgnify:FL=1
MVDLNRFYDVIIIGGGPAGLTAGIYLSRAKYRVLIVEKAQFGGQITITSEVVNYPGVKKVSGYELTETMRKQAEDFGAEFLLAEVLKLELDKDIKRIKTSKGDFECFGVLLATGASPRKVGFIGEEEFKGHGVAYCATCDGEFFTGKDIFVIGGGFAAAEESIFLTKFAKHVTILVREEDFTCAKTIADQVKKHPKISVKYNTEVLEVAGKDVITYIKYKNNLTGEVTEYQADEANDFGVFVFAGYVPETSLVKGIAEVNNQNYIITDANQKTTVDGLYAAGDVCVKPLRQVVTAVGDGALAATELEKYVAHLHDKTNIIPKQPTKKEEVVKEEKTNKESSLFSPEIISQLNTVFSKMENPLMLKVYLDNRPISKELNEYVQELVSLTDKLSMSVTIGSNKEYPYVSICDSKGNETGLAFHGVPGGHEFTSFILGLYNASGKGQQIPIDIEQQINNINKKIDIKVIVSLTCTMCPELVVASQKIASLSQNVTSHIYDVNHFDELKSKYKVMSVPCLVINDNQVYFGKKNINQLL